jgi:hypothetical protein
MDAKLFRLPTQPNFYAAIQAADPVNLENRSRYTQLPTPDSRFPGWAAPMADGRLTTDYRPRCSTNVPVGNQFVTKGWLQQNADSIISVSRKRMAENVGAVYGLDHSVVPPAALYVDCSRDGCTMTPSKDRAAIGTERLGAQAPDLFGTFSVPILRAQPSQVAITTKYEGGRNTPRGPGPELR